MLPAVLLGKTVFTGNSKHLCTKSRSLESLHSSLIDFWLQQTGRRSRDKRRTHHSLVQETLQLITQLPTGCTFAPFHLLQFLHSCAYLETPDNCISASSLICGLSRCPDFYIQPQNAMYCSINVFLWQMEKGLEKKKSLRVFKQYNNGPTGRSPWLFFSLSANSTSQS